MIPYMVGNLSPNSSHLTRGLVEYVPGRGYFRAVSSQNGDILVTSPSPPIVELVERSTRKTSPGRLSSSHQVLQQLQTFEGLDKISFTDFLSKLRIAVMNGTGVALVPPDDCKLR